MVQYCRKCGKEIEGDASFCPNCGTPIKAPPAPPPRKNYPITVGIMEIVVAVVVLVFAVLFLISSGYPSVRVDTLLLGIGMLVASILSILGGVMSLKSTSYALVVIGAVCN